MAITALKASEKTKDAKKRKDAPPPEDEDVTMDEEGSDERENNVVETISSGESEGEGNKNDREDEEDLPVSIDLGSVEENAHEESDDLPKGKGGKAEASSGEVEMTPYEFIEYIEYEEAIEPANEPYNCTSCMCIITSDNVSPF